MNLVVSKRLLRGYESPRQKSTQEVVKDPWFRSKYFSRDDSGSLAGIAQGVKY